MKRAELVEELVTTYDTDAGWVARVVEEKCGDLTTEYVPETEELSAIGAMLIREDFASFEWTVVEARLPRR